MIHLIDNIDDPHLSVYRDLKHRDAQEEGPRFIVEGENVVRRLLDSTFTCESILVMSRKADSIASVTPANIPIYSAPEMMVNEIVGFRFHSGVMACGLRKPPPTVSEILQNNPRNMTLVICPEITDGANLGSIIRVAAGFGAAGILLGEHCRDPFIRQTIRVSMGTIFKLPILRSKNIAQDLQYLKDSHVELFATVLDTDAEPLNTVTHKSRTGLLLGNEGPGLEHPIINLCHRRITIPMHLQTDSLNVSIAAAVFLYHLTSVVSS